MCWGVEIDRNSNLLFLRKMGGAFCFEGVQSSKTSIFICGLERATAKE